jgi:acyl-coenzyme A synthetase/AMP-(fatty) acid ligase
VVAWYATLKLGASFTGVNFTFTEKEIAYQISHADPKVMIVEDSFVGKFDNIKDQLTGINAKVVSNTVADTAGKEWLRFSDVIKTHDRTEVDRMVSEDDIHKWN